MTDDVGGDVAAELKQALTTVATAGALGSTTSHSELLRTILETAARVMGAESAVLLLVDQDGDELVFDVTLGVETEDAQKLKLPLGEGVAGLVAASGQPLAISNADRDPRVAPEIGAALSYVPQSLLCVPLLDGDRVIGVLEVLDKDDGTSFSARDVETLGLFARQAALAIRLSRARGDLIGLLGELLSGPGSYERAGAIAARVEKDPEYALTRELTDLVLEVARYGEDEARACTSLLRGFAEYLRTRPRPDAGGERAG